MITGILFDADIRNGGSYQMSVNNLLQFKKSFSNSNIKFIILAHEKSYVLDNLNIDYEIIKLSILDYIYIFLINTPLFKYLINKFNFYSIFEKKLVSKNISKIIFLFTSYKSFLLKKIKFISTVLDVCHRDFPEFKEVGNFKTFFFREYLNNKTLPFSFLIITESEELKDKIVKLYQLDSNKIVAIPNLPSKVISDNENYLINNVKEKYNIKNDFYFYPAQFWKHKNHIVILKCLEKLKKQGINLHFVFCGRDKGYLKYIKKKIIEYKINENIKILDYVEDEELLLLYKLCKALVMPTYFGPTNIPPVEAWHLDIPVLYSSNLKNHGKDAALYFAPDSEDELIQQLKNLDSLSIKKNLVLNGQKRLKEIIKERNENIEKFIKEIAIMNSNI